MTSCTRRRAPTPGACGCRGCLEGTCVDLRLRGDDVVTPPARPFPRGRLLASAGDCGCGGYRIASGARSDRLARPPCGHTGSRAVAEETIVMVSGRVRLSVAEAR